MSHNNHVYHRERELHCRAMAARARDPDVRRRHEELASLHADRALHSSGFASGGESSAI